jgi:hypothetical protein
MDHHDWTNWPEDDPELGAADTTDLSDPAHSFDTAFDDSHLHGAGHPGDHDAADGLDPTDEPLPVDHLAHTPIGYGDLSGHEPDVSTHDADLSTHDTELAGHDLTSHDAELSGHDAVPADLSDHVHPATTEVPVGADPDAEPASHLDTGDTGQDPPFPPALDWQAPEPVDGPPWADPGVLGHGALADLTLLPGVGDHPGSAELLAYAGLDDPGGHVAPGGDHWATLMTSDDPATSTLARWWSPGQPT